MASATPDLRLPSQLQDIAAPRLVPITLLSHRDTCVNNLPKVVTLLNSGTAESWTHDLSSRKPRP